MFAIFASAMVLFATLSVALVLASKHRQQADETETYDVEDYDVEDYDDVAADQPEAAEEQPRYVVFYTAEGRRCDGTLTLGKLELRVEWVTEEGKISSMTSFFKPTRAEEFSFPVNGERAVYRGLNDLLTAETICGIFQLVDPKNVYRLATEEEVRMHRLLGYLVEIVAQVEDLRHNGDQYTRNRLRQLFESCQAEFGLEPADIFGMLRHLEVILGGWWFHRQSDISLVQSTYEKFLAAAN